MSRLGEEAQQILRVLRESIFRDVADQLDEEIAAGKMEFVRERKRKRNEGMTHAAFEVIPADEVGRYAKSSTVDVRVTEYSTDEADKAAKLALHRLFIEPGKLVDPLLKTLRLEHFGAISFAEPDTPEQRVSLEEYVEVLRGPEAQRLNSALEDRQEK